LNTSVGPEVGDVPPPSTSPFVPKQPPENIEGKLEQPAGCRAKALQYNPDSKQYEILRAKVYDSSAYCFYDFRS
jgi:hypothetical protein